MQENMIIRNADGVEVEQMIRMAAAEGWNPGISDGQAFFLANKQGFWIGELDHKIIACISAVNYNGIYSFVGLYIVDPAYRGRGYGYRIWQHALARLDSSIICGLDGVPARIADYKKSGFVYAYRQMRLAAPALRVAMPEDVQFFTTDVTKALLAYDAAIFGTDRSAFTSGWITMKGAQTFFTQEQGKVTGYAVLRRCLEGYKIGPLFADNADLSEKLFLACHSVAAPGEMVYIDMSEDNDCTHSWIKRYHLQLVFETARMYKNGIPDFPAGKVYGVTTFELG